MRRIHFDNLKNWNWMAVLVLSLLLILFGSFDIIGFENPVINTILTGTGFFLQVIFLSRMFWYKNFVQWNKKGAVIKLNSLVWKSLNFRVIKASELNNKELIITKTTGTKVTFDLKGIEESDTQKLNEIILKNINGNSVKINA